MALDKATLGQRYICFECETKFYDLNRPEPICPSCGADQRERTDDASASPAPKSPPPKAEEPDDSTAEAEIDAALATDIDEDEDDEEVGLSELGAPDAAAEEESDGEEY